KRIGREKKRCGYAPFNSAQQAIKLRSLRSLRPSGKLPSATCFIAGPLAVILLRPLNHKTTGQKLKTTDAEIRSKSTTN
ncbi:MAG: hypothetical protein K8G78_06630, partial [Deltaproteobacteria bacterium]|nr:hypothetical protein [Candidatus Kapabacteria bacterium]